MDRTEQFLSGLTALCQAHGFLLWTDGSNEHIRIEELEGDGQYQVANHDNGHCTYPVIYWE